MKRIFKIEVSLLIEGKADDREIAACLGADMEEAIRRHHTADDCNNFGLTDDGDLVDWHVSDARLIGGDSLV